MLLAIVKDYDHGAKNHHYNPHQKEHRTVHLIPVINCII